MELGVEELPYGLIEPISNQIKDNIEKSLSDNNAKYSEIKTYTTPRRLVFIVDGLKEVQPDIQKIYRGPNVKVAYGVDGQPSQAALGFARKFGANASDLYTMEDGGQEYVALKILEKGKSLTDIIPDIIPDCVLKVQGSHFMRWAAFDEKFSRPIRWIVSILDNKEIAVEITGIKSSKQSRAHRFCADKFPEITDVDSYFSIMHNHNVIVDENERKDAIVKAVKELAASINAEVRIEPELLKEVTNIVEWPKPVLGNFEEKYLAIPEPVIVTVMASHQRYFPIYSKDGKLLNGFITVANYVGDDISNIKNGNERVIKARLDDAIFFYNEDIKKPLIERVDDLAGMTFQKGLGSLKDKVSRIAKISDKISTTIGLSDTDEKYKSVMKTALYCKADLTTSLVFEFTELQGVIGAHYAKVFGENEGVLKGIEEHYYPLVADAQLASTIEGQIVGIADKLDTVCGVFILNKIPNGSVDPLGVRRAAVGILQTIMQKKLNINLVELIDFTLSIFDNKIDNPKILRNDIVQFFIQRLKGIFAGKYQPDYIEAVLGANNVLKSLSGTIERLKLINEVAETSEFEKIVAAHTRISKLIKNDKLKDISDSIGNEFSITISDIMNKEDKGLVGKNTTAVVDESLFETAAEDDFYRYVAQLKSIPAISSKLLYESLVKFTPIIDKFFEDVMVMSDDIRIKNNRLRLLDDANKEFMKIADFTKIVK